MAARLQATLAAFSATLCQAGATDIAAFGGDYDGPVGKFNGFKPANGTGRPVFIWLPGTGDDHWPPSIQHLVYQMALRNFVAVSVDYNNGDAATPDDWNPCGDYEFGQQKARNIFQGANSALGKVCAMQEADCTQGIAVSGHSQGGFFTLLSVGAAAAGVPSYAVTAIMPYAASLGGENKGCVFGAQNLPFTCVDGPQIDEVLPKSKRRYIIGEDDVLVGGGLETIYKEYKSMSGYDCGASNDCLQADGSGYFIIRGSEFEQATCTTASHATFFASAQMQDGLLLCDFTNGTQKWAMKSSFDWLASAATADDFVVPHVGDDFEGSKIPCEAACTGEIPDICAIIQSIIQFYEMLAAAALFVGICCLCCCAGLIYYCCCRGKKEMGGSAVEVQTRSG